MRMISIFALLSPLFIWSTGASAHAYLDHASPRVGSTVASSPDKVTLYFSQGLEPRFSRAEVRSSAGARVDQGSSVSGNMIHVSVKGLAPGRYRVQWRVLSVDSHTTQGSFSFRVGK